MTADEVVTAAVAWAAEICAISSTYTFMTGEKSKVLPDVMGDLNERRFALEDATNFPGLQLQQVALEIFNLNLSFLVDNSDQGQAAATLRGYSDALGVGVRNDATLHGRVQVASPFVTFDFARPFVEYEDGTVGRELTMQMLVAELVEV